MKKEKLTELIAEYLNEQEVPYLKELCMKAAKQGYSFSDEMLEEETAEFIPTDEEVSQSGANKIVLFFHRGMVLEAVQNVGEITLVIVDRDTEGAVDALTVESKKAFIFVDSETAFDPDRVEAVNREISEQLI